MSHLVYLKVAGHAHPGIPEHSVYRGWVRLESAVLGRGVPGIPAAEASAALSSGAVLTKKVGPLSPTLAQACVAGRAIPWMVLDFLEANGKAFRMYARIVLEEVAVSRVNTVGGSKKGTTLEQIQVMYRKARRESVAQGGGNYKP